MTEQDEAAARVARHLSGGTEWIVLREVGPRRWYAPWLRRPGGFEGGGATENRGEARFLEFRDRLRERSLRGSDFRGGAVTWVTVRDHWTGDEDLKWIWARMAPTEVRRVTITADGVEIDTGAVAGGR